MAPHKVETGIVDAQIVTTKTKGVVDLSSEASNGSETAHQIIDIRRESKDDSLVQDIKSGLQVPDGQEKTIPTLLLYDEVGLQLFEQITYLEEYYLTNTEIDLLEEHAGDLASRMQSGSMLIELGSGNLRKIDILLRAIDRLGKQVNYFALDLDQDELSRTLSAIPLNAYSHVRCHGLLGTYDDGLAWLQSEGVRDIPKTVLSLGSSIGNFDRPAAAKFLRGFTEAMSSNDHFLLAVDGCTDSDRVYHAYNDREGITHKFLLNGLSHANRLIGQEIFDPQLWTAEGRYNVEEGRHEAFVFPSKDLQVLGNVVKAGERVRIEESYKWTPKQLDELWASAGVNEVASWACKRGDYAMHLIAKNPYAGPWDPAEYAATPAPTWQEWLQLWKVWDTVTRQMLPDEELLEKPIKLRNACIFYLGHIPGFFDIKLTAEYPEQGPTEPAFYHNIFERGIDPDVDNPEQCHAHSEIPDSWPPVSDILAYQQRVRDRVERMYLNGDSASVKGARVLWLGFEHEAMHLETLLYMLIQSEKTLPPRGVPLPVFENLAEMNRTRAVENQWFDIPARDLTIGLADPETSEGPQRYFGWDVEKPPRNISVPAFQAKAHAITIGDYVQYLEETGKTTIPASWTESTEPATSGGANGTSHKEDTRMVRTVFGSVPLRYVLDWPVAASYDELAGCAAWMGGRIPTFDEAQSIYAHAEALQAASAQQQHGAKIPAVNGHLLNAGVAESPPAISSANGESAKLDPRSLFASLKHANVDFRSWTPAPVTHRGNSLAGRAELGGLWEWTATPLAEHKGYEPMRLYPQYSADFMDGKHNIVLGGSWATVARIAGRRSFVNWYQRNYPFVWAGARVVRDA